MSEILKNESEAPTSVHTTAFLLSQVGAHVGMKFGERLFHYGLTPAQFGILSLLAREDGVTQRFLADHLGVVPSRLVVLVDELEGIGLVKRGTSAPDRRTHAIHLTAAGRVKLTEVQAMILEHDEALLVALSEEEKAKLRSLLERIAAREGLSPGVHPTYKLLGRRSKES